MIKSVKIRSIRVIHVIRLPISLQLYLRYDLLFKRSQDMFSHFSIAEMGVSK
jgi:hypothetical protein